MSPTRLFRPLTAAALLLSASAASAVSILSVQAELHDPNDSRNYVDVWVKQSPDAWKDNVFSITGDPGMLRVQAQNENVPFYLLEPPATNEVSVFWGNDWAPGWQDLGGSALANFSERTVTVFDWSNPLSYFHYQFYGDVVRMIWSNDAMEPPRVPEAASTALLVGGPIAAFALYLRRKRNRNRAG